MDIETVRGATGDARPMDERPDASGPPAATLVCHRAQTRSPRQPRLPAQPSPPQAQQRPQKACASSAPGPAGPGSDADREGPVSSPRPSATTLDGALRAQPSSGTPLP